LYAIVGTKVTTSSNCDVYGKLGAGSSLGSNNTIGADATVGKTLTTQSNCTVNGKVGDLVVMGTNVDVLNGATINDGVQLDTNVTIGEGAKVLKGLRLEYGVCVEQGVTVRMNIRPRSKVTFSGIESAKTENGSYSLQNGVCIYRESKITFGYGLWSSIKCSIYNKIKIFFMNFALLLCYQKL
jgi:UDP-3-O-[3-hydroxymyristoyl] glucosamine N-acyltransferase